MHEVLIIGGGLVGSYCACRLAQAGRRALVLERKPRLEGKSVCTGIIGKECADTFAIDKKFVLREANSARLFSPSGQMVRVWRPETQAYILDRAALDVSFAERAQNAGAEYTLDCAVQHVEVGRESVAVRASRNGKETSFTAAALLVACGFNPGLTESLGMGKPGDFVAGVQAEVAAPDIDEVEVYTGREVAPGFFGWLAPAAPGRARVGLLSRRNPAVYLHKLLANLKAQGKIAETEAVIHHGIIPLKPLARTYAGRALIVGDAAGQVKPTTGGGIYYGLISADIAVNSLEEAFRTGDFSAPALSGYQRSWQRKLKRELSIDYRARKMFERLSDGRIDQIFDIIIKNGIDKELAHAEDLSFDWHGKAVLRLLGNSMMRSAFGRLGFPFRADRD